MAGVNRGGSGAGGPGSSTLPPQELLEDLCSRFVLNAPEEELRSFERILFYVEQAHWFYEDYTMEQNQYLKSLTLREFTSLMFHSCSALRPYITHFDDIYKDFTTYKTSVPVTGAIMLDESYQRCLLVKGWKAGASWSFPRGKKNKDEEDCDCAVREVWEETGYDVSEKLKIEDHLEVVMGVQRMRLYIIAGVNESIPFAPQTKKEISEIAWHRVDELPVASNEAPSHHRGPTGLKYFMVFPFVTPLKKWIEEHCPPGLQRPGSPLQGVTVWKVKNMASGASGVSIPPSQATPLLPASTLRPSTPSTPISSTLTSEQLTQTPVTSPPEEPPGKAFRNFRFDFALILEQL
ncbi:unnamed protein product [Sphagnum troendelagicum]|uniref:Nudix hydrolase domain-containing protein n=1 Tax=Sphagnum troendelagicum TaxID=128251 RepID=A0ABP0U7A4_9BRYO